MKKIILVCALVAIGFGGFAQPDNAAHHAKMRWWKDAKFGMFIHWGIYAVPAGKWGEKNTFGEWIMLQNKIPRSQYVQFAKQFNPTQFNAEEWVKLAKNAGQKYIVLTSKHHDGFALFNSKASAYNIVQATPYKKDIIEAFANACRKYDMKMGLYYSQAQDWYHPGGAIFWGNKEWDSSHVGSMASYIDSIAVPQVKEILTNYGDVAVLWWDTPVGMMREMSQKLANITKQYPNLITNNRLGGGFGGDLETPEQFIPATGFPGRNWEVCMTMNGHWGYNAYDERWKSTKDLLQKLVDIVSKGGNFLLNVGPNASGVIPEVCQTQLNEIGSWLQENGEAIYGTTASPFPYLSFGRATRKKQLLYLHVFNWPEGRKLIVPLNNKVTKAYLLADKSTALPIAKVGQNLTIQLPRFAPQAHVSVIAVEFSGEPQVDIIASVGKSVIASSVDTTSTANALADNNPTTKWRAKKGDKSAVLEMDLLKPQTIGAICLIEAASADGVLQHRKQEHELQFWDGKDWKTIAQIVTEGAGLQKEFTPVKAQKFRLLVTNKTVEPSLAEWVLYKNE